MQIMQNYHKSDVSRINMKIDVCSHMVQMKKKRWATDQNKCQHASNEEEDKEYEQERVSEIADEHEVPQTHDVQKQKEKELKADAQ